MDWDKKKGVGSKERRRKNEEGRGGELVEKGDLAKKEWGINQKKGEERRGKRTENQEREGD